jgi:putative peptide modification system cyclase
VLLPTVTEVGGHLRVSLEVVDPSTQATVYTEAAEGRGKASLLASLDSANEDLREQLGEGVGDIRARNKPLAQVTTSSLEALRAYSLAVDAARASKFQEALRLLNLAIKIDPNFALAYSSRGQLYLGANDNARARADFAVAAKHRDKLTVREAMTLDTTEAALGPPGEALAKYKLFTDMYPDQYGPYVRSAQLNWAYLQHFEEGIERLQPALSQTNPRRESAFYLLGLMNLALGRNDAAKAAFLSYEGLGGRGFNLDYAALYASQRHYREAERILRKRPDYGLLGADLDQRLTEISYPADHGDLAKATAAAAELRRVATPDVPLQARAYEMMIASLRAYTAGKGELPNLRRLVASEAKLAADPNHSDSFHARFASLYGASLLARLGDANAARAVVEPLRKQILASGFPTLVDMMAMADAEIALAAGKTDAAIAALAPRVTGAELYQVHAVLLRAYVAKHSRAEALAQARWLSSHRGRAYVEWSSQYVLQPSNLVESNLALLSEAELLREDGQTKPAADALAAFNNAWPKPPGMVARRLAQL